MAAEIFETLGERVTPLPEAEAAWINDRVSTVSNALKVREQYGDVLFDGYDDDRTAHLNLLLFEQECREQGFSEDSCRTLMNLAFDFALAAGLPTEAIQANLETVPSEHFTLFS